LSEIGAQFEGSGGSDQEHAPGAEAPNSPIPAKPKAKALGYLEAEAGIEATAVGCAEAHRSFARVGHPELWGAGYALEMCGRIAQCTEVEGKITRLFLSPATHQVHALLRMEMETLGMSVREDAAGNLRGIYAGETSDAPVLLMGSHVDTVPDAGAFDGVLGVAVPLAVLRGLGGRRLKSAVEVIAFSEEEGIRFRMPFLGSRAVVGSLDAAMLARTDGDGVSVEEAIREFGLDPAELDGAGLTTGTFCFVETHIEQGPVLEALDLPLGIVTAIVGQTRLEVTFRGRANHAGTTPMHLRQDALAAAAAWISTVERHARNVTGLVATVGMIAVQPGAANVVPGVAVVSLDVRHANDAMREQAVTELLGEAKRLGDTRGVRAASRETSRADAVAMDERVCKLLANAVETVGAPVHRMVSGAGHDAMILAGRVPAAMLFIRTPAGLSHHPDEAVAEADVQVAVDVLGQLLESLNTDETPMAPIEAGAVR
jgi:allantoate deiminase